LHLYKEHVRAERDSSCFLNGFDEPIYAAAAAAAAAAAVSVVDFDDAFDHYQLQKTKID